MMSSNPPAYLRALLDGSSDASVLCLSNGVIWHANDVAIRILQITPDEDVKGVSVSTHISFSAAAPSSRFLSWSEVTGTGTFRNDRKNARGVATTATGKCFPVTMTIVRFQLDEVVDLNPSSGLAEISNNNNNGHNRSFFCLYIQHDKDSLTSIQRKMESLEGNIARHSATRDTILRSTGQFLIVVDADGIIREASPGVAHLFGYEKNNANNDNDENYKVENCHIDELFQGKGSQFISREMTNQLVRKEKHGEKKCNSGGRKLVDLQVQSSIIPPTEGNPGTDAGIMIKDITGQKPPQCQNQQPNNKSVPPHEITETKKDVTIGILDASFDSLFVMTEQCIIEMVNQTSCDMFGWTEEEFIGQNIRMIMPKHMASRHDAYVARYLETGIKKMMGKQREVMAQRKDGSTFPCMLGLSQCRNSGLICGFIRNLSPEKEAESKYLEKQTQVYSKEIQLKQKITETKEIMNALVKNQSMVMGILDASFHSLFVIDENCIIQMVNKKSCDDFGWTKEEFLGENINMIMTPDVACNHDQYMKNYLSTRMKKMIGTQREVTACRKDGSTFPCVLGLSETQNFGLYCGFIRDLTAEKKAASDMRAKTNELIRNESIVLGILNASSNALFVIDENCIIQMVNSKSSEVFGWTEEEFLGKNINMIMPADVAMHHDNYMKNFLNTGIKKMIGTQREVTACRKDGSSFPCLLDLSEAKGSGLICGFIRDLTNQKASEAALIENNRSLEVNQNIMSGILDAAFHALFVINDKCIIQMVNEKACDVFGWKREEFIGRNVNMIMPPEIAPHHDQYMKQYIETGVKKMMGTQREVTARRKDGTTFPCSLGISEPGQSGLFCGFIRDLTQEKAREAEIIAKQVAAENLSNELQANQGIIMGILDAAFHALFVIDENCIIQMVNKKSCEVFGWTKEEFVGRNINVIMPAHVAEKHDQYMKCYLETGVKKMIGTQRELIACRKDGSTFPCVLGLSETEKAGMICGFIRDLTKDKAAQAALLAKNAELQIQQNLIMSILDASFDGLFVIDEQCTIRMVNSRSCKVFGWTKEEFMGQNINMIMPPAIAEVHDGFMENYLKTGFKKMIGTLREVTARRKDGTTFPCRLGLSETKESGMFCGFIHDLTDEKAAEAEILAKKRLSEKIIDASFDSLFVINERGIIEMVNKTSTTVFGWTTEEFIGQNISMIMPGDHAENHNSYLERYTKTRFKKMIGKEREVEARRKDGSTFPCMLGISEVENGGSTQYVGFIRDVTIQKSLLLAQAEREASDSLLYNILPEHIANRLKEDPSHIADLYSNTTILFADIVGFTDRTSVMSPHDGKTI